MGDRDMPRDANRMAARFVEEQLAVAREETELQAAVRGVRETVRATLEYAHAIAHRVMPPAPTNGGTTGEKLGTVATTYADQIRELDRMADQLRGILGELNARI